MPVFVDGFGGDVNTAEDTSLNVSLPDRSYGDAPSLSYATSLLRFNLSSIPAGSTCTGATLYLYNTETKTSNRTLTIYRLATANNGWIEGVQANPGTGYSTYNFKVHNTTAWAGSAGLSTPGTDYDSTALGSATYTANDPIGTEIAISLNTTAIANLFGGNANLVLKENISLGVGSAENATTGYRPKLVISYTEAGGISRPIYMIQPANHPVRRMN